MTEEIYPTHEWIECVDSYVLPDYLYWWEPCPKCGIKPKVWVFNNGRSTACGCCNNRYDHFSIHAESVASVLKRTGGTNMSDYDSDELRNNWNHFCVTGQVLFEHAGKRTDGRW